MEIKCRFTGRLIKWEPVTSLKKNLLSFRFEMWTESNVNNWNTMFRYVEQLVASAEAAVEEVVKRGVSIIWS